MKKVTPTQLRKDLYHLLDEILESGEGIEVSRPGGKVVLLAQKGPAKLSNLRRRSTIIGEADNIDAVGWEDAWQPDCI